MAEIPDGGRPAHVDQALESYVAGGCPAEVNQYLDDLGLDHPPLTHRRQKSGSAIEPHALPASACPDGHPAVKWVPDREGGHQFWYCAP